MPIVNGKDEHCGACKYYKENMGIGTGGVCRFNPENIHKYFHEWCG